MDTEPRDMNMWLQETLNNWVDQGALPTDRSAQLECRIRRLARQDRKNRVMRKLYGLALAIATCIWFLFVNCPAAAASYIVTPYSSHSASLNILILLSVFSGYLVKLAVHLPIKDALGEV